jgi:hypothetical protein
MSICWVEYLTVECTKFVAQQTDIASLEVDPALAMSMIAQTSRYEARASSFSVVCWFAFARRPFEKLG